MSSTLKFNPFTHKLDFTGTGGAGGAKFSAIISQVFTSNGTYTPTVGMAYCLIQSIGGGGGGGGTGSGFNTASGGGAGEYAQGIFTNASIGASQIITIGAAGSVGANADGGTGGTTSVGILITAIGGNGGSKGTTTTIAVTPASLGGTGGTGGDFRSQGAPGGGGVQYEVGGVPSVLFSGAGGSSQFGAGGASLYLPSVGNAGLNAAGYGSGGGGACNKTGGATQAGGTATAGIVIITEYIST